MNGDFDDFGDDELGDDGEENDVDDEGDDDGISKSGTICESRLVIISLHCLGPVNFNKVTSFSSAALVGQAV